VIFFAAIAPHGDVDAAPELRAAMDELGRRYAASGCEGVVVVTPHNVHVEGNFAVVTAGRVGEYETDRALAADLVGGIREAGLPVVGVSYGGNDPAEAELPLDWGTEVPLHFVHAARVVVVAPARDLSLDSHVALGEAIARATGTRRIGLVASADHAHAHDLEGPYGFDPAAAAYDSRFLELLAAEPLDFRPLAELVEAAKADSLWQLLVLQGAASGRAELLAYAAPTYYGMAVAVVETLELPA
jgi:aromatic ring-opening dioxygenase LigB subunit